MRKTIVLANIILMCLTSLFSEPSGVSAQEMMGGFHLLGMVDSLHLDFNMTIKSNQGVKEREMVLMMDRSGGEEKLLVSIVSPQYLSNMKYLSVKKNSRENLWLKTSRGVRRLSTGNFGDSLFGSDFSVEDLSLIDISRYEWFYEPDDKNGQTRIKAVPVDDSFFYSYKIFSIDTEKQIVSHISFFNEEDSIIKEYKLLEHMLVGEEDFPRRMVMKTMEHNTETVITVQKVNLNPLLSAGVFNKGNL